MENNVCSKYWPVGLPRSLDYPLVPVSTFLKSTAARYPEKIGVIFNEQSLTYASLWEEACRLATALNDLGLEKGEVVALLMPNLPEFLVAYYGLLLAGGVFSPCSPMLTEHELGNQLRDCQAKFIISFAPLRPVLEKALPGTAIRQVIFTGPGESGPPFLPEIATVGKHSLHELINHYPPVPPDISIDPRRDLAHIAYTGGTTGVSKGVMLTHFNVLSGVMQTAHWSTSGRPRLEDGILHIVDQYQPERGGHWEYRPVGAGLLVTVAPWFHAMGIMVGVNTPIYTGMTLVVHSRFEPIKYLDDVEKYRATMISGAPALYRAILQSPGLYARDLSSVQMIRSGSAPLPVEINHQLRKIFPQATISEGYGMTESSLCVVSGLTNWSGRRKPEAAGIAVFDTELKIVDLEDGHELPAGARGEICARGPQVMQGYLNRPAETAEVLRNGWLHTGDIGYLDEEGFLFVVDRKKDMLIYKGYNVYPRELEEILHQHLAVAQCAVIGLPDELAGEIPKAFVVLREGAVVKESELSDWINERVAPYKKVRAMEFVSEIPMTTTGKILKRVLLDRERTKSGGYNQFLRSTQPRETRGYGE